MVKATGEQEPNEQSLSALVLSGYTFVVGTTKDGDVFLHIPEEPAMDKIYMSTTEALMLSLAFKQAVEEIASDH